MIAVMPAGSGNGNTTTLASQPENLGKSTPDSTSLLASRSETSSSEGQYDGLISFFKQKYLYKKNSIPPFFFQVAALSLIQILFMKTSTSIVSELRWLEAVPK